MALELLAFFYGYHEKRIVRENNSPTLDTILT